MVSLLPGKYGIIRNREEDRVQVAVMNAQGAIQHYYNMRFFRRLTAHRREDSKASSGIDEQNKMTQAKGERRIYESKRKQHSAFLKFAI
jgi:hypothetical protein